MSEPKDKTLYQKAKDKYSSMKHSAYKSGLIVKYYKELYVQKHKSTDAYVGTKNKNKGLSRWFKEDWQTSDGKKEYSKKADVFRPTKKVSKDTPTTYKELTKKQVRDAMIEKAKTGRVKKYDK
tara:strand:+ start:464 stop:832 length:369 start_codon:yes stop_codon:yes gene_type:complete